MRGSMLAVVLAFLAAAPMGCAPARDGARRAPASEAAAGGLVGGLIGRHHEITKCCPRCGRCFHRSKSRCPHCGVELESRG